MRTDPRFAELHEGYRSSIGMNPKDFPTRETALALVEALRKAEAGTWSELDKLSGVSNAYDVVGQCFAVYGYPELAPGEVGKRLCEVIVRPRTATTTAHTPAPERLAEQPDVPAPDLSHGFTPRR